MATIDIRGDTLTITPTRIERLLGFSGRVQVPLRHLTGVDVLRVPGAYVSGMRAPGISLPRLRIGTWRHPKTHASPTYACLTPGQAAVRLRIRGLELGEAIVSLADPTRAANRIRAAAAEAGADVAAVIEREVVIDTPDVDICGTFTLPAGAGPFPAALLLAGSGPLNRDEDGVAVPLGSLRDIAGSLAAAGIASIRYDKRGVGGSGGDRNTTGMSDLRRDAELVLDWLDHRVEVDSHRLIAIGHSEGAAYAAELAGRGSRLSAVVLLAPMLATGAQTSAWQTDTVLEEVPEAVRSMLDVFGFDPRKQQAEQLDQIRNSRDDVIRVRGMQVPAKWTREYLDYDPWPALRAISVPALAIGGTKDLQCDATDLPSLPGKASAPVEAVVWPDLTHILRVDPDRPSLKSYRKLWAQPTEPALLAALVDWLGSRLGPPAGQSSSSSS